MRVVTGRDEHGIDGTVRKGLLCVGRVRLEAEFLSHALCCDPPCGHYGKQFAALTRMRDQKLLREAAGTDERNPRLLWGGVRHWPRCLNSVYRRFLGVL